VNAAAGPYDIAALLLVLGGALKAVDPVETANALRGVGVPGARPIVRLGGAAEVAIGAFAIVSGGRLGGLLVALSYLAFTGFVVLALVRDVPIATCGCFGKADAPPSLVHVAVNLACAGAGLAVAIDPGVGIAHVLDEQPLLGLPYLLLVAIGLYLAFLSLTLLPRALALVRESRST
jgi:hypothetical protein